MSIHSKSYPMQTTPAVSGYVRPPTTLHEHFRANPLGMTFPEWCTARPTLLILLDAPAHVEAWDEFGNDGWRVVTSTPATVRAALASCVNEWAQYQNKVRVVLLDGTVIKEWFPETKDSATVEKAR